MSLTFYQLALALPLGAAFSAVGTVVGLGGGIFMVPVLVLVFDVPLKTAIAVTTFSIVPACLLSTLFNARRGLIDYVAGLSLEVPALAGVAVGIVLVTRLPVRPLELVFAALAAVLAYQLLMRGGAAQSDWLERINRLPPYVLRRYAEHSYHVGIPGVTAIGLIAGMFAALFGMGGGVFKTPALVRIFHMPTRVAAATALFTIMFTSLAASLSHWQQGRMDWDLALPLAGAFLVGSLAGNRLALQVAARTVERLLGAILAVLALVIAGHAVFGTT